jgi:hypothetical protein
MLNCNLATIQYLDFDFTACKRSNNASLKILVRTNLNPSVDSKSIITLHCIQRINDTFCLKKPSLDSRHLSTAQL